MPASPLAEQPEDPPALSIEQARSELASCVLGSSYKFCLGALAAGLGLDAHRA